MKIQLKVLGGSKAGQLINISVPQFLVGRAEDCHLKPRSELISRYHCAIISEEGYAAIRDLGSKNGIFHNGLRVTMEEELKNGDRLLIGPLEFEVLLTVSLKGETKSKVETIQDVVARTVEQGSSRHSQVAKQESEDKSATEEENSFVSAWLMDGDPNQDETQTFPIAPEDTDSFLADLQYKKEEEETSADKKPAPPQGGKPANTQDTAANLLKNFFKGGR